MTVNINIGGGAGGGTSKANVYDDSGNKISKTGAPADYDMDYAMEADASMDTPMPSMEEDIEGSSDDLGLEDEGGGGEMPDEGAEMPDEGAEMPDEGEIPEEGG